MVRGISDGGLAEETSLRAYMQFTLARGLAGMYGSWFRAKHRLVLGFWTAALLLGCLFVSNHSGNPGESRLGLIQLGLFALLMCFRSGVRAHFGGRSVSMRPSSGRKPSSLALPIAGGNKRAFAWISSPWQHSAQRWISRGRGQRAGDNSVGARSRLSGRDNLTLTLANRGIARESDDTRRSKSAVRHRVHLTCALGFVNQRLFVSITRLWSVKIAAEKPICRD